MRVALRPFRNRKTVEKNHPTPKNRKKNSIYLHVGLPSPPQLTLGEGEGTATRRLPRDPCDISIGLSSIPLDNICVQQLFEISSGGA